MQRHVASFCALCILIVLCGCPAPTSGPETTTVAVTGVSLDKAKASLVVGSTEQLKATVAPENATDKSVSWSTSEKTVADVDSSGLVTAASAGKATITVTTTDGSRSATCEVTVTAATVAATGVTLNASRVSVPVGGTAALTAAVSPDTATDASVGWTSSDDTVATVDSSGLVTGVSVGTVSITVKTADGGFTAACAVTVYTHGELDASFGAAGKVVSLLGFDSVDARSVALQADGKIVVVGTAYRAGAADFAVARLNGDGTLDTSFGSGGVATADFGTNDQGSGVVIRPDGRILVVGMAGDLGLALFNSDGSLDASFGTGGMLTVSLPKGMEAGDTWRAVRQPDGKFVVAGAGYDEVPYWELVIARFGEDGGLDTSFGAGGFVAVSDLGPGDEYATAIALQSDGKVVAAGNCFNGKDYDIAIVSVNADGSMDTSFSGDGELTLACGSSDDSAWAVACDTDRRVVVAGESSNPSAMFALARCAADGSLDASFDTDGKLTTAFGPDAGARALVIQSDGKIIAAGYSGEDCALARYNTDGSLDVTFGTSGKVTTATAETDCSVNGLALQADGRIIGLGSGYDPAENEYLMLIRYWP